MILGVFTVWLALAAPVLGLAQRDEETLVYVREIAPTLVTREAGDKLPRELHFQLAGSDVKLNLRLRRNNLDNENAAVYVIRTGADGKDVFVRRKLAPETNTGLYQDPDHGGAFSVRCSQGQDRPSNKSLWGTLYIDGAPHTLYPEEKHLTTHASADSAQRYILRREPTTSYKRADPIQVTDHLIIRQTDSPFRSSVYTSPSGSRTFGVELLAVVDYRIYKEFFEEKIQRRRALNYPWLPYPLDPAYNYNHNQNSNYNNNNYNNNNYNNQNNINNGYNNNGYNNNGFNNNNNNNGYNNNNNNNGYNSNNYNDNKHKNNNYNKYPNNNYTTYTNAAPVETREERVLREIRQYYTHVLNGVDLRYASIDADDFSIYLKVAGLIIADKPDKSPWSESRARSGAAYGSTRDIIDATPTLKDFRDWVQSADKLPTPADHAMLFTGYNLFQDGSTSTLGVAYMKGVCGSWKTSLIQDHGNIMSTIETATHELGHNLGASHDGYKNACKSSLQFIMAQYAGTRHDAIKLNPWKWSTCSVTYFRKFLENLVKGSNNCLANEAKHGDEYEFHLHTSQLAGQIYTVPEQCQLIQDSTSQPCYNLFKPEEVCQKMYCRKTSGTCAKYLAARGTSCGDMRWCIDGSCQYDPRAPRQING